MNLGVSATVREINEIAPYPAGLITVALGGTKLLSSFVQPKPFYTAQNVAVLQPKAAMTFEQKLFVCLAIRHNRFRYSAFGREANRTIKNILIPELTPNWIGDASASAHSQFSARLAPLKKQILPPDAAAPEVGGQRVAISEMFEVDYGTNLELNKLEHDPFGINFVSRTARNNGVSAKIKPLEKVTPIKGGVITVALGGSVLESFLQLEPFYSGFHIYCLKPKVSLSLDELLFYCACIRANMFRYSYGRQANRTLRSLSIPAQAAIPKWVYGGSAATVDQIEAEIGKAEH